MKKVFVITGGSYSDYGIVGVFSTRELAEFVMNELTIGDDIEEYTLDPGIQEFHQGLRVFQVELQLETADVHRCEEFGLPDYEDDEFFHPKQTYWYDPWPHVAINGFRVRCWAKDRDHAIKIASEKLSQWKAMMYQLASQTPISGPKD